MNSSAPSFPTYNPQATTSLWLIRHAEVEPQYQSVFGGRIDMGISERGHRQALHWRLIYTEGSSMRCMRAR